MDWQYVPFLDSPALQRFGPPEVFYGAQPAAGTDFTLAIDGGQAVRIISVFCRIVTDGTVASREVVLEYRDQQANRFDLMGIPVTVSAGSTNDYCFSAFQPVATSPSDATLLVPLHPSLLMGSWSARLHIVNVQAGDQLSRIRIKLERFYSDFPPPGRDPSTF
jgi:hypothetical protein